MSTPQALDPIRLEIVHNALRSVADEAYIALMKSAYSTNIKERHDHSAALLDAQGRLVVQTERTIPMHLGSMLGLLDSIRRKYELEEIHPGDIFAGNDPYLAGGTHLPDVNLAMPVFLEGRLVAFACNVAHHADIGGMSPGSMDGNMSEIFQEGLRIPPVRVCRDGEIVEDILSMVLLNVRVPEERRGDYMAQIAANRLGLRRLEELFQRWSPEDIEAGAQKIIDAVARRMRTGIAEIPDGRYAFTDYLDDDGMSTRDIAIAVTITKSGEEIHFDFDGSAPQVQGNMNNSYAGLQASVLYALKVLVDPDGPTNHGMLEPVTITAPEATVVNAVFPAATAARAQTAQRIVDAIFGAMADALPERIIAAGNGANGCATFSGVGPDGKYYVYLETIGGGAGGRAYRDGNDGIQVHITNTSNLPIEALENEYPLLVERYELVEDSGGAGRHRGGMGLRRVYRGIDHQLTFSGQNERGVHPPWGLFGGGPGGKGRMEIVHDDGRRDVLAGKPSSLDVPESAVVWVETPGAGGYGPAAERSAEALQVDRESGKFTEGYLAEAYGPRAVDG